MISNKGFWSVIGRIDWDSRKRMNSRPKRAISRSERELLIREEVPYNPLQIIREASRLATEAGVKNAENWRLDGEGASVGVFRYEKDSINFFCERREDCEPGDADKFAALEVLAQVCEYVRRKEKG